MNYQQEALILEQNKRIIDLEKEVQEKGSFLWVFGEVVKYSSKLKSENELASLVIDMLIGILGLKSCTLYLKQDEAYYHEYQVDNAAYNNFQHKRVDNLSPILTALKDIEVLDSKEGSELYLKIYNYIDDEVIGYLTAKQHSGFFTKTKVDFFKTLAVQLSNIFINAKMHKKIMELSNKDILTNCYNRRYLDDLRDYHEAKSITYILIDLDNFKMVNDTLGHETGDQLLVDIAKLSLDFFETYHGRVIRYGGDEFIVVLEKSLSESEEILIEFKRTFLSSKAIKDLPVPVTASFGIANYPVHTDHLDDLLGLADKALYQAKNKGKNIIINYSKITERT